MPKKKITLEEYKNSQEYKMWSHIEQLCNQYELSGDNYITRKDLGGFFGSHCGIVFINLV